MLVTIDLRGQFGPVRDQGARPTCLAFATSDAHAGLRQGWDPLSCEYVFYHAQKRAGQTPTKGAFLNDMLATLETEGQPKEQEWPYLPALPSDLSQYHPPTAVGALYGREAEQPRQDLDLIRGALNQQRPAIVLSTLTRRFFQPPNDGVVMHDDQDRVFPAPRHAIVAVGYGEFGGQKVILIRNSWGPSWGMAGHIWLTEDYLRRHMYGLALLKEACDVPDRTVAA
ncbi:peptidase C1 [Paracoccus sp. 08]|nr:peptidase C1 [Paracoccus sp. 08]